MQLNKTTFNRLEKPIKLRRVSAKNHQGILVETSRSKRSLFLKYTSPVTLKYRQVLLASFNWSVVVTAKDINNALNKATGYREQINKGYDPLDEKKRVRAEVKAQVEVIKNRVALEDVWREFEKMEKYTRLSKNTQIQYRSAYYRHVAPTFGKTDVTTIRRKHILEALQGKPLSAQNFMLSVLKHLQRLCLDKEMIDTPFVVEIEMHRVKKRKGFLTADQLATYIPYIQTDLTMGKQASYFQLLSGTRISEEKWTPLFLLYDEPFLNNHKRNKV